MTKKFYLSLTVLLLLGITLFSCSKENELVIENSIQNKIVNEFINSNTFNRVKNKINSYGTISSQNVSIDSIIVKDKGTFHYFTIAIKQNNIIKATLYVAVLDNTSNLPYNDKYVMNLNDMTDFDINNLSGKVELYDLNYDNFNHTEVKINNNKIENITYHSPSVQFLNKFVSLKLKSNNILKNFSKSTFSKASKIPCDKNGNGNLGYFECYGCFKSAAEIEDSFGNWWCDVPVVGWGSCWASMSTSCAILASIY